MNINSTVIVAIFTHFQLRKFGQNYTCMIINMYRNVIWNSSDSSLNTVMFHYLNFKRNLGERICKLVITDLIT